MHAWSVPQEVISLTQKLRPAVSAVRFRKSRYCCLTKKSGVSIGFVGGAEAIDQPISRINEAVNRLPFLCHGGSLNPRGRRGEVLVRLSSNLKLVAILAQPERACATCWRAWLNTRLRASLGYCWHGYIAWRVRPSGEFITAEGVDRAKHLAMVRALQKREPQGLHSLASHIPSMGSG